MGNYYGLTDFLFRLRSLVIVRGGALAATGRLFTVDNIEFGAASAGSDDLREVSVSAYIYGTGVTPPRPRRRRRRRTRPEPDHCSGDGISRAGPSGATNLAKKKFDPKAKEKKQKKMAIAGFVLLLALGAYQGPKTMKLLNPGPPPQSVSTVPTPTPATPAPATPGATATPATPSEQRRPRQRSSAPTFSS